MAVREADSAHDVQVVEELLRLLGKGQRALQMYLPNNPVYHRTLQQATEAFGPVWERLDSVVLDIREDAIMWEDSAVLRSAGKSEGLSWQLYKDGLRQLVFLPGVEHDEIFSFLTVVNAARMLPTDATDDLLTLLWEKAFLCINYTFVEVLGDGVEFMQGSPSIERRASGSGSSISSRDEVAAGRAAPAGSPDAAGGGHGVVDLEEFDATLYFLDEAEIRHLQEQLDDEYKRDIRQDAINALLDILENERDTAVRAEVIALLENILPAQLATGGFRSVAALLRELRAIAARAPDHDDDLRTSVLAFEERLSSPEVLEQLFRILTDHGGRSGDDDVGEVLRELKPTALPVVLAQWTRIADPGARRVLEATVDALARSRPDVLASVIAAGPDDALVPAIALAARLNLSQLVPQIIEHLKVGDDPLRLTAIRALGELGTPSAVAALEGALDDPERGVRQAALVHLLARGGSGGMVPRLEQILFDESDRDWERSERRSMFEAYGIVAGARGVPKLQELVEPRGMFRRKVSAEARASALFGLAKIATSDARAVVERFKGDKDPVVRSAANTALREWAR